MLFSVVALIAGCTPQDAEVEGDFAIFLDATNSENIRRLDARKPIEDRDNYMGFTPVDCRDLYVADDTDPEALDEVSGEQAAVERLPGVTYVGDCVDPATETRWPSTYFTWIDDQAFWLNEGTFGVGQDIEPWRTEAVMNPEGDLQLTVHVKVPPIGDFRFGWVIAPSFQPTACLDGDGGAELVDVDGGNWLEHWSAAEEKGGTLWHLTAGSYQSNPMSTEASETDYWIFDERWSAGYSFGRYEDDDFYGHATDYLDPDYIPLYMPTYASQGNAFPEPDDSGYATWLASVDQSLASASELATMGRSSVFNADAPPTFKLEDNAWRYGDQTDTNADGVVDSEDDSTAAGLEDWIGISPSWVRVDNPEAIMVDNTEPITGSFQVYLETASAASRVVVRGEFTINNVREDVWGYDPLLEDIKREENDTPECGEERMNYWE